MLSSSELRSLSRQADEIRISTIWTIAHLGVGHLGGALSIADVLTLLYYKEMNVNPQNPRMEGRDLLVLSKGHAGPALYATLAAKGFFPPSWLETLNKGGTNLPSHCDRNRTPGIDMTTGSLGQGLSAACGMAYACKLDGKKSTIYAIIGDGETDEGQNWEAAMFARQCKLDNLIAFTDYNKMQIDGTTEQVMDLEDLTEKWKAFGWNTFRVNGHDISAIHEAIAQAKLASGKPSMIILDTIKGYGAPFAEGQVGNHNMKVTIEQAQQAEASIRSKQS